jgi:hypothetical protein
MEQNTKKPFFASLLESQPKTLNPETQSFTSRTVDGPGGGTTWPGVDYETMKAPSDDDELPPSM